MRRLVRLLADVRHEGHETGSLDRILDGALEGGTIAAAFAAEELPLTRAHLLQARHILVVHVSRPRASFLGAEATAILSSSTQLFPNHSVSSRTQFIFARGLRNAEPLNYWLAMAPSTGSGTLPLPLLFGRTG